MQINELLCMFLWPCFYGGGYWCKLKFPHFIKNRGYNRREVTLNVNCESNLILRRWQKNKNSTNSRFLTTVYPNWLLYFSDTFLQPTLTVTFLWSPKITCFDHKTMPGKSHLFIVMFLSWSREHPAGLCVPRVKVLDSNPKMFSISRPIKSKYSL